MPTQLRSLRLIEGYRIGWVRPGYDADLVFWDSHPLRLGATPLQVLIEGETIVRASDKLWESNLKQKNALASAPESRTQVSNDERTCSKGKKNLVLRGITKSFLSGLRTSVLSNATAIVHDGVIQCVGGNECEIMAERAIGQGFPVMDLKDGYILPVRFGSSIW